jgi:hypothetical protein
VDEGTLRALRDLPDDLRALGWEFVPEESVEGAGNDLRWYLAIFARPYRHGVDAVRYVGLVHTAYVRIALDAARTASAKEARRTAIMQMRLVDRERRRDLRG